MDELHVATVELHDLEVGRLVTTTINLEGEEDCTGVGVQRAQ